MPNSNATEDEPLSPSRVAAHVLTLVILLIGGCLIEGIRKRYEPPIFTSAMMGLGEVTILVYMVGGLVRACKWTYNEWTGKETTVRGPGKGRLQQFIPRMIDIKNVFKPGRVVRAILILIITCAIVLSVLEFFSHSGVSTHKYAKLKVTSGERRESKALSYKIRPYVEPSFVGFVLEWFNHYSPYMLVAVGVLTGLTVIGIFSIIFVRRRETYG
jgi:hypothetical protein